MSGYMGFGMQSWLCKKRPRKPFTKRGKVPSFTPLHNYSRTFNLKPHSKKNTMISILTIIIIILITAFSLSNANKFLDYSKKHRERISEQIKEQDEKAFNFLLKSGKKRLLSNNTVGAYSEFNLAYQLRPNNEELNQLLIETLSILCTKNSDYCDKLNSHLDVQF